MTYEKRSSYQILSEEDYLDFMIKVATLPHGVTLSGNARDLPACIKMALSGTSLLLLGYNVYDWDFRVLFRGVIQATGESRSSRQTPRSICMQLAPQSHHGAPGQRVRVQEYLQKYFERANFDVYWGDIDSCVADLTRLYVGGEHG